MIIHKEKKGAVDKVIRFRHINILFLLCAAILATRIRKSPGVTGIKINNVEYLMSQFADGTSVYLDGSRESFENVINNIN